MVNLSLNDSVQLRCIMYSWVYKDIRCLIDCVKMETGVYSRRLSIIIGTVLTVVSSLCIVFGIVGGAVGDKIEVVGLEELDDDPISWNIVAGFGAVCSILVSITQSNV